ncbi:MAG: ferritin [ANME-2 cluster archaeon]|nr:ferritin [ANME-2 cluster archaeon]
MKVFKCKICQEGYLGDAPPTHCPFCGAHQPYLIEAKDFELPEYTLTAVSRNNLEEALKLEVSNAEFYFCAAGRSDNVTDATMFKRLGKIESEHASTIAKELKVPTPDISRDKDMCSDENVGNLAESHQREANAIDHYTQFLGEATEERIKEVFTAIIEIEKDHLSLTEGRF